MEILGIDHAFAVFCMSNSPQKPHPVRRSAQIYRVTQRLVARSRRTPRVLILPMLLGAFRPPKPENRILLRYALDGHGYISSCTVFPERWLCACLGNLQSRAGACSRRPQ